MWWDCLSWNVKCYSLPIGHRKRCDETACHCHSLPVGHSRKSDKTVFHKMCNVTYCLLVIGKDIWDCLSQNVQCHSLPVGHRKRCDDCLSQNVQHHSLAVGSHRKRCGETVIVFHKTCNVTHLLLVIGKYVIRLPFTKCAMSLTSCWS